MAGLAAGGEASGPSTTRRGIAQREPRWDEYLAFAEVRLGITPERFYRLTPRMFAALHGAWEAQQRETLAAFASLRMELINRSMRHSEKWVTLEELMPSGKTPRKKRMTKADRMRLESQIESAMSRMRGGVIVQTADGKIVSDSSQCSG